MFCTALVRWFILAELVARSIAGCFDPTPAFPLPSYHKSQPELKAAFKSIQAEFESFISSSEYDASSFSVEITSSKEVLWSSYHTARDRNESRPGAKEVNGDSAYRIASITKTFTTLGILQEHAKGNLHLDTPVNHYIAALNGTQKGTLPWKDITLRSLASQLSGLPRDWSPGNMLPVADAAEIGLPPPENTALPHCEGYKDYDVPCTSKDMLRFIKTLNPVFAPNSKSTYSNLAFELLGLVLANVSGMPYEKYIQKNVLDPLELKGISFDIPPDDVAVLPKGDSWYWEVDEGVHNPTGGLYASASSMSAYLQYILTHYNGLHTGSNWLQPASFSHTTSSFYGMPWEIFHVSSPLLLPKTRRPVTFYNKSGGIPGYFSLIMLIPDYDLAVTILVAGELEIVAKIREAVTTPLIRAADQIASQQAARKYSGTFKATHLNSTLVLKSTGKGELVVERFISNGTDVIKSLSGIFGVSGKLGTKFQLIPTLLFVDEQNKRGEKWRAVVVPQRLGKKRSKDSRGGSKVFDQAMVQNEAVMAAQSDAGHVGTTHDEVIDDDTDEEYQPQVWDEYCITDIDYAMYDGNSINEFIFWDSHSETSKGTTQHDRPAARVEPTAFRISLDRVEEDVKNHQEHLNTGEWGALDWAAQKVQNAFGKDQTRVGGTKGELKRRLWNHGRAEL